MGTMVSSRSRVSTKPPTCCERWRGKPISALANATARAIVSFAGSKLPWRTSRSSYSLAAAAPDAAGERRGDVLGQAEDLADFADGAARPVGDDRRRDRRVLMAVALIDVLDHLFAPLMLEIDVDVGRLLAFLRDEALEQEVDRTGIDAGDAERETDRGIGRRAAPLAEDLPRLGEPDDVAHGEEIGRVIERRDQRELLFQRRAHLVRNALWDSAPRHLPRSDPPDEAAASCLWAPARRDNCI